MKQKNVSKWNLLNKRAGAKLPEDRYGFVILYPF